MRPSEALQLHREEIRRIVESRCATNPRIFGSVLHGEDTEESDLCQYQLKIPHSAG
jgi:hypothetical protein